MRQQAVKTEVDAQHAEHVQPQDAGNQPGPTEQPGDQRQQGQKMHDDDDDSIPPVNPHRLRRLGASKRAAGYFFYLAHPKLGNDLIRIPVSQNV